MTTRFCRKCGKAFEPLSRSGQRQVYCTTTCRYPFIDHPVQAPVWRECLQCQASYRVWQEHKERPQRFCSSGCASRHRHQARRAASHP